MLYNPINNFKNLKNDFKLDTGLDADKELALYLAYYNARMSDMNYQINHELTKLLEGVVKDLKSKRIL